MGSLFGGKKQPAPVVTPPAPMPDTNSPAILEARRKATEEALKRGGRASTILSAGNTANGSGSGDSYSSSTLGS